VQLLKTRFVPFREVRIPKQDLMKFRNCLVFGALNWGARWDFDSCLVRETSGCWRFKCSLVEVEMHNKRQTGMEIVSILEITGVNMSRFWQVLGLQNGYLLEVWLSPGGVMDAKTKVQDWKLLVLYLFVGKTNWGFGCCLVRETGN